MVDYTIQVRDPHFWVACSSPASVMKYSQLIILNKKSADDNNINNKLNINIDLVCKAMGTDGK